MFVGWMTGAIRYIRNSRVGVVEKLGSTGGSVRSGLIALLLSDRVGIDANASSAPPSAAAQKVRDDLRAKLQS